MSIRDVTARLLLIQTRKSLSGGLTIKLLLLSYQTSLSGRSGHLCFMDQIGFLKDINAVLFKFRHYHYWFTKVKIKVKIKCGLLWGHNHFSLLVPLTLMRSQLICSKHPCNGINRKWKSSYSGCGASWMHNLNGQRLYNPFGAVAEPFPTLRAAFLTPRVNEAAG